MTWQNGRQLASLVKSGVTTSCVYNADGIRTQKTVGGGVHNYILDGTRILADYNSGSDLKFAYNETNTPQSFTYNGTKYNYITNLQGDVIEIRDSTNTLVGSYVYNAYGKIVSMSGSMASINPLRYRGYYSDAETGFYYLNSRYYDPEIGRFINSDSLIDSNDFLGYNLFAYCGNNPVMNSDPSGTMATDILTEINKYYVEQYYIEEAQYGQYVEEQRKDSWKKTYMAGVTGSFGAGVGITGSFGLAIDYDGNIGIIASLGGFGGTPSLSGGAFASGTNAPEIGKLKGWSMQAGGSIVGLGGEYIIFKDSETDEFYNGGSITATLGPIPADVHAEGTYTWMLYKTNVVDLVFNYLFME